MADIGEWYQRMPQFTKWWLSLSLALPLLGRFGLLSFRYLILSPEDVIYNLQLSRLEESQHPVLPQLSRLEEPATNPGVVLQLWRPVTALFYYPITPQNGFHYLINLFFLYNYSMRLETGTFERKPADYLFMLIFNWLCLVLYSQIVGMATKLMLLMDPMVLSVLYVWCQLNRDVVVSFWFGTRFKAMYLPWVLLGFNVILGGGGMFELLGILVGHLYYFLAIRYPQDHHCAPLIQTPAILEQYFPPIAHPSGYFGSFGYGGQPEQQPPPGRGRGGHSWGQGHVLGGR
ncbi:DERL1 [Cordylochernes scorpioides]|uniref:Derlin n=1 Tax=Cordylochernes scorpioides TaxID=51811 RepID=A0ABY6KIS4_9ARAC|nr:DERL1 [Cordylochernes scorpioides]